MNNSNNSKNTIIRNNTKNNIMHNNNSNNSNNSKNPIMRNNTKKNNYNRDILVISYDEYLNDFDEDNIKNNEEFINYIKLHKYIVLCTQKSKSSSTRTQLSFGTSVKHFQHIFKSYIEKNNYIQIAKYDSATPLSAEVTDNYSIRTRIFKNNKYTNISESNITFDEIKNGSFRNYFRNTANKTAVLCRFKIKNNNEEKIYNIINTDLFSLKNDSRPMYNDGLLYKQQQFLAIIKDFKIYNKYAYGENIILAGSLKFNIYPLKMTNILTYNNMNKINKYLLGLKNSGNKNKLNKLKKYNELNKYLDKLIENYKQNNNISIPINMEKYKEEHKNIYELLLKFKENLVMNITGNSKHEKIKSGLLGSIPKGIIKATETSSRFIGTQVKLLSTSSESGSSTKISPTRSSSTISAKDRILYALKNNEKEQINTYYNIFDVGKKIGSTLIGNNKFVTLSINYTKNNNIT